MYIILAINKPSVAKDAEESDEESDDADESPKTKTSQVYTKHIIYIIIYIY